MTKREILNNYNLTLDDDDGNNFDGLYSLLTEYELATPDEIDLVVNINGRNVESLLDIVYCRAGLRSIEQLVDEYSDGSDDDDETSDDE